MARKKIISENIDVKNKILDAATTIFAKKSCLNFSIGDVAKVADIEPPLIYYYFKDKNDLIAQTLMATYHKIQDLLNSVPISNDESDEIIFKRMLHAVYDFCILDTRYAAIGKQFLLLNYFGEPLNTLCQHECGPHPNRVEILVCNMAGKSKTVTDIGISSMLFCYMPLLDFISYINTYPPEKRDAVVETFINALWNSIAS